MGADRYSPKKPTYLESARRLRNGDFDPITASSQEVIARFLIQAGHFQDGDDAARHASALLSVGEEGFVSNADYLLHIRLQDIIREANVLDDKWEDEDDIAGDIYNLLRITLDDSKEYVDLRKALHRLLLLRGADVKMGGSEGEVDNIKRWEILLRKIGSKALGSAR